MGTSRLSLLPHGRHPKLSMVVAPTQFSNVLWDKPSDTGGIASASIAMGFQKDIRSCGVNTDALDLRAASVILSCLTFAVALVATRRFDVLPQGAVLRPLQPLQKHLLFRRWLPMLLPDVRLDEVCPDRCADGL